MFERSGLVRLQQSYDVEIDWRGFQLHPEIPAGGVGVERVFGEHRAEKMRERLSSFAAEMGVEIGRPSRLPSTLKPLAVTEYARDHDALESLRDAIMDAYWREDADIEDDRVLAELAERVGLDPRAAAAAGSDPAFVQRVTAGREDAFDHNVTAIPTLLFGTFPVVGCQSYETLELVAKKLGLSPRS